MSAGFAGQGPATLTEYTAQDERAIALPTANPYSAMIDHVLDASPDRLTTASNPPAPSSPSN